MGRTDRTVRKDILGVTDRTERTDATNRLFRPIIPIRLIKPMRPICFLLRVEVFFFFFNFLYNLDIL